MSKKIRILAVVSFCAFVGLGQSLANQAGIVVQGEVYHKTPTQMANSISAAIAGLATGPFIWSAAAHYVGRSSVIFWTSICNLAVNIWSACMTGPDDYVPFVVSRWLGGTFGSGATTIGAGIILDIFFLHERGRAFACYTLATLFGTQVGGTLSGYITAFAPWPVYFWWTVGALGLAAILALLFLEDTTYDPATQYDGTAHRSWLGDRVATFLPGNRIVKSTARHSPLEPILIAVQPVTLLAGLFLMIVFAWAVGVTTLLRYVSSNGTTFVISANILAVFSCKLQSSSVGTASAQKPMPT
jgi:MFS family permease